MEGRWCGCIIQRSSRTRDWFPFQVECQAWCRYVMNFIFVAFPVLPVLEWLDSPAPHRHQVMNLGLTSSRFLLSWSPFCSSTHFFFLTCQTFPGFDQHVALECASKFCGTFTHVLMSNDQYSSASSIPKDTISGTTDINSTATSVFPLPIISSNSICRR